MEALPFADGRFDRVTCRFGIMFTPDPVAALREARRVLRPGGRAAFMVWGERHQVTMFRVVHGVIRDVLGASPHDGTDFNPFRFGAPGDLAARFAEAGFTAVEEREARFAPKMEPGVPFWRQNLETGLGERFHALDEATRERLDQGCAQAFEAYRDGDVIQLSAVARIVAAEA